MWLLNVVSYELEAFEGSQVPEYAILSHRWETEEVSFKDMSAHRYHGMRGFSKISLCCNQAIVDRLSYVWIDTCCIDKRSSAELSEAINSMYRWYRNAKVCYAYLSDILVSSESKPIITFSDNPKTDFTQSIWFTRSWTLQELLAPREMMFYDREWTCIGSKPELAERISDDRGIPTQALYHFVPDAWSVAERMSWASDRLTTRVEDQTYSLFGLFDINMPLLYGEGNKAFQRLQEHIMAVSDDLSIFAWSRYPNPQFPMLADGPQSFSGAYHVPKDEVSVLEACTVNLRNPKIRFYKEVVPYALSKNSIEGSFKLHHYTFNIDCLCVGQFFLDYESDKPGELEATEEWEQRLWHLFIFVEYDPRTDIHRRVTLDGVNNLAFSKSQVHGRSNERICKFVKSELYNISSGYFSMAQLERCIASYTPSLVGGKLRPRFVATGAFSSHFYLSPDASQQVTQCKFVPGRSQSHSPCVGVWSGLESLIREVPNLVIHFGCQLGSQPRVMFSFQIPSKDELQTLRARHSNIPPTKHHTCYTSGCAVINPGVRHYGKLKDMYLAARNKAKYESRVKDGWPITSIPGQHLSSTKIDGIGEIVFSAEGNMNASLPSAPPATVHVHFRFREYVPGVELFPDGWASFPKILAGRNYIIPPNFRWPGRRCNPDESNG